MPAWLTSALRTGVQSAWGLAAAWLIAHQIPVPRDAPEIVQIIIAVAVVSAVTAMIRWLETRPKSWRACRLVARVAMLWMAHNSKERPKASIAFDHSAAGALRVVDDDRDVLRVPYA